MQQRPFESFRAAVTAFDTNNGKESAYAASVANKGEGVIQVCNACCNPTRGRVLARDTCCKQELHPGSCLHTCRRQA